MCGIIPQHWIPTPRKGHSHPTSTSILDSSINSFPESTLIFLSTGRFPSSHKQDVNKGGKLPLPLNALDLLSSWHYSICRVLSQKYQLWPQTIPQFLLILLPSPIAFWPHNANQTILKEVINVSPNSTSKLFLPLSL